MLQTSQPFKHGGRTIQGLQGLALSGLQNDTLLLTDVVLPASKLDLKREIDALNARLSASQQVPTAATTWQFSLINSTWYKVQEGCGHLPAHRPVWCLRVQLIHSRAPPDPAACAQGPTGATGAQGPTGTGGPGIFSTRQRTLCGGGLPELQPLKLSRICDNAALLKIIALFRR